MHGNILLYLNFHSVIRLPDQIKLRPVRIFLEIRHVFTSEFLLAFGVQKLLMKKSFKNTSLGWRQA